MAAIELEEHLQAIESRIACACDRAGRRSEDVRLLPASKRQPETALRQLYDLGVRDFGESRVQELLKKKASLPMDIRWHFIGHLQSNKARQIADFIHSVHSIDSIETARELHRRAVEHNRNIKVLLEVNISGEEQKEGVGPDETIPLLQRITDDCPNLIPSGLMGMASNEEDVERIRPQFRLLRRLRDEIQERHPEQTTFNDLSMGMSNDFEIAIEEGATIVRIGSALFSGNT